MMQAQRTYALVMRRELGRFGVWLAGSGLGVGCCGYLIATVAAGGRHAVWPYFLFGAMTAVGCVLILVGRGSERARAEGSEAAQRLADLGVLLRGIATGRGLTEDDVRARVQGPWRAGEVEQYLAGTSRPDWAFVQAFAMVAGGNKWHRADIERQVRPVWRAAAPGTSPAAPQQQSRALRVRSATPKVLVRVIVPLAAAAALLTVIVLEFGHPGAHLPLTVLVHANTPVTATGGGQATGVQVRLGQKVRISATGRIVYGYETVNCPGTPYTDAAGHRTSSITGRPCGEKFDSNAAMPAPHFPVGSLLWRVTDSGWAVAGTSAVITAPENGMLYLGVNDDVPQDNSGFFTVRLTNGP